MNNAVVLIGIGEIGGVFARGFLKIGYPVYPIGRRTDLGDAVKEVYHPQAVVVAVGEKDLPNVLQAIPAPWRDKLVLLQNELLPKDWESQGINDPTVISVWFEKKPGWDAKVIIPSPIFGPRADCVSEALRAVNIDCTVLDDENAMLFELVVKNVYILTANIAGLEVGGTVGELWSRYQTFARNVAGDIMGIQFSLIGKELDHQKVIDAVVNAFNGDVHHKCMGRSALMRLQRAIAQADAFGLDAKSLRGIYKNREQASVS